MTGQSRRQFFRVAATAAAAASFPTVLIQRAQAAAPAVPKEFKIGWQKGSAILVLAKHQQAFEKRLKSLGVESVKWVEFQFGPPLLEGLGLGAVDLGAVGDTPPIFAQVAGAKLVYAAATPASQNAILVPKDSPIKTVADLKGRRVAFGKGSSSHAVTVRALAHAGLSPKDIQEVYLAPADATAAFSGGRVDAWTVWDPYYAIAEQKYNARVLIDTSASHLASLFVLAGQPRVRRDLSGGARRGPGRGRQAGCLGRRPPQGVRRVLREGDRRRAGSDPGRVPARPVRVGAGDRQSHPVAAGAGRVLP